MNHSRNVWVKGKNRSKQGHENKGKTAFIQNASRRQRKKAKGGRNTQDVGEWPD